jgi:hypothetical protein
MNAGSISQRAATGIDENSAILANEQVQNRVPVLTGLHDGVASNLSNVDFNNARLSP